MRKNLRLGSVMAVLLLTALGGRPLLAAKCTPSGQGKCTACKNCNYCGHCAKNGGTCSVCKRK